MNSGKIAIIGGGRVGMTTAYTLLLKNTAREIVLYDRDVDRMRGEQSDFQDSLAFVGTTSVTVAESVEALKNSDVIVYTAGAAQKTGQSRLELANTNKEIMAAILPPIIKVSPESIILIVANPVDILVEHAYKILSLPKGRIFGSGTMLDTARFRFHLSEELQVNPRNIHADILGEHGDSSFPVLSNTNVGGQPLTTMAGATSDLVQKAYLKTREEAGTIIATKGATYYAIAIVVNELVTAVVHDTKNIYPVSVPLTGEYGYSDVALSVPSVIGINGVEKVLEIPLSDEEKQKFNASVQVLKGLL